MLSILYVVKCLGILSGKPANKVLLFTGRATRCPLDNEVARLNYMYMCCFCVALFFKIIFSVQSRN